MSASRPKPTAAAMRAAEAVFECPMLNEIRERQIYMLAECIDRETALPGLILALRTADTAIDEEKALQASRGESVCVHLGVAQSAVCKALAKLEGQ